MNRRSWPAVDVVIPALNERDSLPFVLAGIERRLVRRVVVVDNGSTDGTGDLARALGAVVVAEPRRGYGRACLAGLAHLATAAATPDIVVFLDADSSDRPEELPRLLAPIVEKRADLVIGSRVLGDAEPGALPRHARWGNRFAAALIRVLYGRRFTDLGPFRAIRWDALESLRMTDPNFGWTVEMQVKAIRKGLRVEEVPVSYRRRVGVSKISGTVGGSLRAGWKILYTVLRHAAPRSRAGGR